MRVTKLKLPQKLEAGDLVEYTGTGSFYLVVKSATKGYSIVCLSSCQLYNTNTVEAEEALSRISSGTYIVHKKDGFELVIS